MLTHSMWRRTWGGPSASPRCSGAPPTTRSGEWCKVKLARIHQRLEKEGQSAFQVVISGSPAATLAMASVMLRRWILASKIILRILYNSVIFVTEHNFSSVEDEPLILITASAVRRQTTRARLRNHSASPSPYYNGLSGHSPVNRRAECLSSSLVWQDSSI